MDTFCPLNKEAWRDWLEVNHVTKDSIWLIFYKKKSPNPNLTWSEAVDEALCFGWIDSVKKTIDNERYKQYFSKRKAKSTWSKVNKDKVDFLMKQDLIVEAGYKCIDVAKSNGSWTILDAIDALVIPEDLEQAFKTRKGSKEYYESLSKSAKKGLLYWIISAKRTETRERRIEEVVENASKKLKPKQFR